MLVLIDLKIGKLTHENLGQMQMYVNYYNREVKLKDENPTIGMILCKTKNDALVRLTLPENANIYASQYQLYLPSKEELKRKLIEWWNLHPKFLKPGTSYNVRSDADPNPPRKSSKKLLEPGKIYGW